MAQRRMFSLKIINSARFLKMPIDSQNLYFHLGLHADDDGVVEAYPVIKALGSNEDNLKVLTAKGFIRILNEDLVSFIIDWHEHNLIRADRKVDSIYKNLLLQIVPDAELLDPKPRADTGVIPRQLTGRPLDAIGKVRLGKDSIVEEDITTNFNKNIEIPNNQHQPILLNEKTKFLEYWGEKNQRTGKLRWQEQKYFDIKRRWATWMRNFDKYATAKPEPKKEQLSRIGGASSLKDVLNSKTQ